MTAALQPQRPRRVPWLRILAGLAVLVLCVLLARRLELARLLAALHDARWSLVAAAALVHLTLNTAARVGRWQALLGPIEHRGSGARFAELTSLYFASQAATNLLPARAGEALRVFLLHRRHGYPVTGLITVQLVEILVGAVTLGLFTLPMVPLGKAPASLAVPIFVFALVGPVGLLVLMWLARLAPPRAGDPASTPAVVPPSGWPGKVRGVLRRFVEAVQQIHAPRVWVSSLAWSVLSDLSDLAMIGLSLHAVAIPLEPASWVVLYAAVNIILLLPATPAQIGVLEVGAVGALRAFGVDAHPALAFALLYHAAHVVPPTLVGATLMCGYDLRPAANEPG